MIGQNINMLIPEPIHSIHDLILLQFMSMDSEFVTQSRRVYGLHQANHIFAVDLDMTPSMNTQGELILTAKFTPVQAPDTTIVLLVDLNGLVVTGINEKGDVRLSIDTQDLFTMNVHIGDVVKGFESYAMNEEHNNVVVKKMSTPFKMRTRKMPLKSKPNSKYVFEVNMIVVWLTPEDGRAFDMNTRTNEDDDNEMDEDSDVGINANGSDRDDDDFEIQVPQDSKKNISSKSLPKIFPEAEVESKFIRINYLYILTTY